MIFQVNDNNVEFLGDDDDVKGEVDFTDAGDGVMDITKTYVAPSERGMGTAGLLMGRAAAHIKSMGKKARLSCSYAKDWFKKHPEYRDLVVE
ncbi:MAG: GNAT family N-acetyltransferase [Parafannyhessea sp.]|uniref:GNAT family N-acetyltransferase n=1 Tax=Parafannyhessea sp. TaxID=2847324 RepID=UPI003F0114D6